MSRNNQQQQQIIQGRPEPPRDSPGYIHHLVCQASLTGMPIVILASEPEILTISLIPGTWHSLETIGGFIDSESIERHPIGAGHDCLIINTSAGVETELTAKQTIELRDNLEILLGKKQPAIIVPSVVAPTNLKGQ